MNGGAQYGLPPDDKILNKMEYEKSNRRIWQPGWLVILTLAAVLSCSDEKEFSEDYDINWPAPVINELSADEVMIDDVVTVVGTGLDKTTRITLSGEACEIVEGSATATEIKFKVARRAKTGKIVIENVYRRYAITSSSLVVNYPEVEVTSWPSTLYVGKAFTLEGTNVDLITQVIVKDSVIDIRNPSSDSKIVVPTSSLGLKAGETVSIKVVSLGPIDVSEVTGIPVEAEQPLVVFKEPIVLWTFEDADPTVTDAGNMAAVDYGRNLNSVPTKRGSNFFSVKTKAPTGGWTNFVYIEKEGPFDLSEFTDPHLTLLVNTNGKQGYINPFFTQNGSEKDNHFTNPTANDKAKYGDDYRIITDGWEWRSYPLSKLYADFTANGTFDRVRMRFTSGNVGNSGSNEDFEIHVDQIMITDGLQLPVEKLWDFEDDAFVWDNSLSPTYGINGSAVGLGEGQKYFTVSKGGVTSWQWQGAIVKNQSIDLSTCDDPHISFLINTGSNRGFVQIEVFQNATKWGGSPESVNYLYDTEGQWKPVTVRLKGLFSNWGGDASEFDASGVLDYVKIGFTTGNVDGENYEVNIDQVYLSDGGMW